MPYLILVNLRQIVENRLIKWIDHSDKIELSLHLLWDLALLEHLCSKLSALLRVLEHPRHLNGAGPTDVVETLPWKPYFTGFLRADLLVSRPKDKEELLRMGFLGHFYGIETFNHDTGKIIGKGMNPDKLQQGLIDVRKYLSENR